MESILVVDDDRHIAELVVLHLEREGFRVTVAHDGQTALDRLAAERPSLVILDVMLPGMSGFDVCREIRSREGPQPIILLLTARVQEADAVTGLEVGADDYVRKPFGIHELVSRVRALLRLSRRDISAPIAAGGALQKGPLSI